MDEFRIQQAKEIFIVLKELNLLINDGHPLSPIQKMKIQKQVIHIEEQAAKMYLTYNDVDAYKKSIDQYTNSIKRKIDKYLHDTINSMDLINFDRTDESLDNQSLNDMSLCDTSLNNTSLEHHLSHLIELDSFRF